MVSSPYHSPESNPYCIASNKKKGKPHKYTEETRIYMKLRRNFTERISHKKRYILCLLVYIQIYIWGRRWTEVRMRSDPFLMEFGWIRLYLCIEVWLIFRNWSLFTLVQYSEAWVVILPGIRRRMIYSDIIILETYCAKKAGNFVISDRNLG